MNSVYDLLGHCAEGGENRSATGSQQQRPAWGSRSTKRFHIKPSPYPMEELRIREDSHGAYVEGLSWHDAGEGNMCTTGGCLIALTLAPTPSSGRVRSACAVGGGGAAKSDRSDDNERPEQPWPHDILCYNGAEGEGFCCDPGCCELTGCGLGI